MKVTFVGHSTVLIELDGIRLLTDPMLRSRVLHIRRRVDPVEVEKLPGIDLALISHVHHDHFDPRSLRMIAGGTTLVLPREAGRLARRLGFDRVVELDESESTSFKGIDVRATFADHRSGRLIHRGPRALGYLISGTQRIYFAGDTDIFPRMSSFPELDLALLPVWGWGRHLGPGHLDPIRAAQALTLLRPRLAIPIHWGTLRSISLRRPRGPVPTEPAREFAHEAARLAPDTQVLVLAPGEAAVVESPFTSERAP
jgi:L-ascorbate metabolism protein UlaG (beta-lactamase superfamily)